jgi:hypothetical protein
MLLNYLACAPAKIWLEARSPIPNTAQRLCVKLSQRTGICAVTGGTYGKAVCRVLDVPVPLATLTDTEVMLCNSV